MVILVSEYLADFVRYFLVDGGLVIIAIFDQFLYVLDSIFQSDDKSSIIPV